jgi:hypothetical protein
MFKFLKDPANLNACIDYIRVIYVLAEKEALLETKKELRFKANDLAKSCMEAEPKSYIAQKW